MVLSRICCEFTWTLTLINYGLHHLASRPAPIGSPDLEEAKDIREEQWVSSVFVLLIHMLLFYLAKPPLLSSPRHGQIRHYLAWDWRLQTKTFTRIRILIHLPRTLHPFDFTCSYSVKKKWLKLCIKPLQTSTDRRCEFLKLKLQVSTNYTPLNWVCVRQIWVFNSQVKETDSMIYLWNSKLNE